MKIVIAFNSGMRQRQRFHQANKSYFYKALKIVRIDALTSPTTEALGVLALLAAVLPGAYLVLRETSTILGIKLTSHTMDIAELSLLYGCMTGIVDPARKLSSIYTKLKRSTAASDRIFELMDKQTLVTETSTPQKMPRHEREIEFQKIEFAYATGEQTGGSNEHKVIDDLSLKVPAGEVVVVVGENGSGKSTLVNLLPRFFDPSHGATLIDGVDTRDVKLQDLRSQIGIVTQETQLFNDTIFNNILIGQPGATSAEVEQAARRAHVMPFLENRERFPEGLQTEVGNKGGQLSGGQRQRIALARAILRNPSILILDEATSAIDANSELLIHETLLEFVYKFSYQAEFGSTGSENELCHVFLGKASNEVNPNDHEISAVRFVGAKSLLREFDSTPELFTPWFRMEWIALVEEYSDALSRYCDIRR